MTAPKDPEATVAPKAPDATTALLATIAPEAIVTVAEAATSANAAPILMNEDPSQIRRKLLVPSSSHSSPTELPVAPAGELLGALVP